MKIRTRIFFCYLLISTVCLYYPTDWVLDTIRTRYLEGVEDPLVDHANTLATAVGMEMTKGRFVSEKWAAAFEQIYQRPLSAQIYQLMKEQVDIRIYITDARGIVVFDSLEPTIVGEDYSKWRDVRLTLEGQYGARTTRESEDDNESSVLYVAAPIVVKGKIAGVLTVGKPTTNITWFVKNAKFQIMAVAVLALLAAILFSYLVSNWITRPIKGLTDYAIAIRDGSRPDFPQLDKSEIGEMGEAFKNMQEALEGRKYVEQYIQNLTHEIKSPLSAIRGAAELLEEPMDEAQRARFLGNIHRESLRIQKVIDRMLELSALENRQKLLKVENVSIKVLVKMVMESMEESFKRKQLEIETILPEDIKIIGDAFLLHQALANLVQNAVDFSPEKGRIMIRVELEDSQFVRVFVTDDGPGLAEFARERIFEKFFSLQRPDTGQKSTGLGLNFVRQIALLHHGDVRLGNRPEGGVEAMLKLAKHTPLLKGRINYEPSQVGAS